MVCNFCRHCRENSSLVEMTLKACRTRFVTGKKAEGRARHQGNQRVESIPVPEASGGWTNMFLFVMQNQTIEVAQEIKGSVKRVEAM